MPFLMTTPELSPFLFLGHFQFFTPSLSLITQSVNPSTSPGQFRVKSDPSLRFILGFLSLYPSSGDLITASPGILPQFCEESSRPAKLVIDLQLDRFPRFHHNCVNAILVPFTILREAELKPTLKRIFQDNFYMKSKYNV